MDLEKREKIIEEQDARSNLLFEKFNLYREADRKFRQFFLNANHVSGIEDISQAERKSESLEKILSLKINNPDKYKKEVEEIYKANPQLESEEFKKAINEWWKYQYDYFGELVDYLNALNNDYNTLFSEEYKEKTFEMARNGLFTFYEQTPDFEDYLTDDVNQNINIVIDALSEDNYRPLLYMLNNILNEEDPSDYLRSAKQHDFREAIVCLLNECYSSCARTMLALIENEHTNASNINADFFEDKITKGNERALKISEQLGSVNVAYFSECWKLMNDFYKEITISANNKSTRFINRNELVHGVYWDAIIPDKKCCLELILFYHSFKIISFFLQQVYDMRTRIKEDYFSFMAFRSDKND